MHEKIETVKRILKHFDQPMTFWVIGTILALAGQYTCLELLKKLGVPIGPEA